MAQLYILSPRAAHGDPGGALQRCARFSRRGDSIALLDAAMAESEEAAALAAGGLVSVFAVECGGGSAPGIHPIGYSGLVELAEEYERYLFWP